MEKTALLKVPEQYLRGAEQLVGVVQDLSNSHDLDEIMNIVRRAARDLTGADGATFVLRDGEYCYYAEENAIAPLWKGQRFPMRSCISGWVMLHSEPVMIEDIYADPRIPHDAYRPTFIKSLAMVPIRSENPIGAIGNYWARHYEPAAEEIYLLQALANVTSVAIENVDLYKRLQLKIDDLEKANETLGRFAWITSHDLKSPLRAIDNLCEWIAEDIQEQKPSQALERLNMLKGRTARMEKLLDDMLEYSQLGPVAPESVDLVEGKVFFESVCALVNIPQGFRVEADDSFLRLNLQRIPLQQIFCNLIDNAITHHDRNTGRIAIAAEILPGEYKFTIADDGPGIPAAYAQKIFEAFQTLKPRDAHEGSGMGLTIVKKILEVHGGKISVVSQSGRGAIFSFTWPRVN